ncbi:capsid assembly scaffolding protein Gp46 family protein [Lactococcus formosensis]|uniref:capsid assembly scaffolding protein Gp46 family protein n=1 Tax=Lactococcus formosensis TaxID=1281486 RepID=UPI00243484A6|nr:DUF4355 domain-containing protein [Lactococcus formosensis]MDG6113756.1 DUF4355 domain-containing protein [Lactococcus formosensis]MDG6122253.1 DUF4355 domain-containing protein [Lactococcus formosensis]MDG6151859.1 DUF4355 domain-containing protein [Lactococcus formosensis]MDG6174921.1 DUF4355 domain-containing protein [Lactococcus formosensis]MDG6181239.1 DUF4355 domain-containing protein [Lactococcus formosensis]
MSEFKTIETQEELDAIIKERLSRADKTHEARIAELETRNKELEADNTAYQATIEESKSWEQEKADYQKQIDTYKTAQLKQSIALKAGLPLDLADRLTGDDEETLKADAERFSSFIKPQTPTPPLARTETNIQKDEDADLRAMLKNLNEKGE